MDSEKSNMFLAMNSKYFPAGKLRFMKETLDKLDESKFMMVQAIDLKDPQTLLIVSIFGGHLGIDRFMLGEVGLGVGKLLTCGGFFVWYIIDLFMIIDATKENNFQKFMEVTAYGSSIW